MLEKSGTTTDPGAQSAPLIAIASVVVSMALIAIGDWGFYWCGSGTASIRPGPD